MLSRVGLVLLFAAIVMSAPAPAGAQSSPLTETTIAERHEVISEKEHHYIGSVELDDGRDTKLYADDVWLYLDQNRAVASGNVVFRQGSSQISADRADFDTKTRLGTFYNASGFAMVQPPKQTSRPGAVAPPPIAGQDTIVYFFGETVEKIGPRKYEIKKGGFTTCVQPTPRWDFHAGTIVLNLDHYTLLTQVVMNVKGVPVFYLPALYYPTKREDRATGFLLPTYGRSSIQGQSLHNAFFWAINRSQDATIVHDWYSKSGQGFGSEYRYNFGGGSDGSLRSYLRNVTSDGSAGSLPPERSYNLSGSATQPLPGRFRATGRVDYFSSIVTNQAINTNLSAASSSQRSFGGNVIGTRGSYSMNATLDHREYFYSPTSSAISGGWPRINVIRNERPIGDTPLYVSASGELVHILSDRRDGDLRNDSGLTRYDFAPRVRFPFKKWQWFTVNSTASWRDTYYSRSYDLTIDPVTGQVPINPVSGLPYIIDTNLNRQYFVVDAQITGPLFNRVFDTPNNGYAEKFKHSVEPFVTIGRTSAIDNFARIVKLEGIDQTVGGDTSLSYGLINRFYAKRRSAIAGQPGQAREILTVEVNQQYHTQKLAAATDPGSSTSNNGVADNNFTPVVLAVRTQPTPEFNATMRSEFDSKYKQLRTIDVSTSYTWSSQLQTSAGWHKRAFIQGLVNFDNPAQLNHSIDASSTVRTRDSKYGAIYSFNYDVLNGNMIQQRLTGFYNAQCCGLAFEFQNYHFGNGIVDRRFFMSFSLAGLGNFSPFNGALGGVPR
jgi:LPS-assembly protein